MSNNLKYSVGVDMSKEKFDACISVIDTEQNVSTKSTRCFPNTQKGFNDFLKWVIKQTKEKFPIVFTMEATGIYYENLANYLYKNECYVSVVLPNKSKKYLQSKGHKSKNDKIDAKGLSEMGAEQKLERWQPMSDSIYNLRSLTRYRIIIVNAKTAAKSQLEAYKYAQVVDKFIVDRYKNIIKTYDKQLEEIDFKIKEIINNDPLLKNKCDKIFKIKGVGLITLATVVAETGGFALFKNAKQLTSYCGLDVIENQSGKRNGKTRISKKGNSFVRRVLYMSVSVAIKHEPVFKQFYNRMFDRMKIYNKANVAVQRKILLLIYALWKKDEEFDSDYYKRFIKKDNTSISESKEEVIKNVAPLIINGATVDRILTKSKNSSLILCKNKTVLC